LQKGAYPSLSASSGNLFPSKQQIKEKKILKRRMTKIKGDLVLEVGGDGWIKPRMDWE
jgi:hypothetical protein